MIFSKKRIGLEVWVENLQAKGRLSFSLDELMKSYKNTSATALKQSLDRLSKKKKVVSVFKGYYVIVPPQYANKGIAPTTLFIDGLMKFLQRNYYVGLLNAAAVHGSSHQQPQEFFVVTEYPVLRKTLKKGLVINYVNTKQMPSEKLLEKRKTETGYINISSPLLTALDLISYEKKIGGLNRAATVINELMENIKPKAITNDWIEYAFATSLQRLGFILDEILDRKDLADKIYSQCKKKEIKFYKIALKASTPKNNKAVNEKWQIIINTEIEID